MPTAKPAFKLSNATFPLFVLHPLQADLAELSLQLAKQVAEVPEFFLDKPVVLNLAALQDDDVVIDWAALKAMLRELGIRLAGVMDGSPAQCIAANQAGLGVLPDRIVRKPAKPMHDSSESETTDASDLSAPAQGELSLAAGDPVSLDAAVPPTDTALSAPQHELNRMPALVIDKPVRTGQRIYAERTDLIVLAVVSAGAELIADGDIHVYAPLRGRALAGARGNDGARIFTLSMEAELVSIAGHFKVVEDVPADLKGKPAQVFLDKNKVVMQPLGALRIT